MAIADRGDPALNQRNEAGAWAKRHWEDADVVSCAEFGMVGMGARPEGPRVTGPSIIVCTYQRANSLRRFLDSLAEQDSLPRKLVIVDASPRNESELVLRGFPSPHSLAECIQYFRVKGRYRGLTRQRNFGLNFVETDLVAFFDDDIFLTPGCLTELERVYREHERETVGVGLVAGPDETEGHFRNPSLLWRVRRWLQIVPDLHPGTYHRCGMSIPWNFQPPIRGVMEGDYLSGYAMMWKTELARQLRFNEDFSGYSQAEDLDFSIRMRRHGKILIAGKARAAHLEDPHGRPNYFQKGYMEVYNRFAIHRRGLENRSIGDIVWFAYAWGMDSLLLARDLARPGMIAPVFKRWGGRAKAAIDLLLRR